MDTVVRATPLAVADYSTATEWFTSIRNKAFADGDAGTGSYTTVTGDRLVIEIGHNDTAGTSISGSSRFGSIGTGGALPENETDAGATLVPWFDTSNTATVSEYFEPSMCRPTPRRSRRRRHLYDLHQHPCIRLGHRSGIGSFSGLLATSATTCQPEGTSRRRPSGTSGSTCT